jgi:hypothetical protein
MHPAGISAYVLNLGKMNVPISSIISESCRFAYTMNNMQTVETMYELFRLNNYAGLHRRVNQFEAVVINLKVLHAC